MPGYLKKPVTVTAGLGFQPAPPTESSPSPSQNALQFLDPEGAGSLVPRGRPTGPPGREQAPTRMNLKILEGAVKETCVLSVTNH